MSRRVKKFNQKTKPQVSGAALSAISEAEIIDLNQILLNKTNLNSTLSDLEKMLQNDLQCSEDNFQLSIMALFFNLCGISLSSAQINVRRLSDDVKRIFQNIYEQPKMIKSSSELPLAGTNNIAHKKMYSRLVEFWEMLINDKTNILTDSKMLVYILQGLQLFCNNKIRSIRSIAVEIANTLVQAIIDSNSTSGTGQRTKAIKKFLYDFYHKVLKQRLQDVDIHIRQRLVHCLTNILGSMSKEFLTVAELQDVYIDMLDKSTNTQHIALESLRKLYSRPIEHKIPLITFGKNLIHKLSQTILKTHNNTLQYVQLLNAMLSFSPEIQIENACDIYCNIVLSSSGKLTIQEAGAIFYKSLFSQYRARSRSETLSSLKDREFISTILRIEGTFAPQQLESMYLSAINFNKEWFDIDEIFLMMVSETIIIDGTQRRMGHQQLKNSLSLLMAYMRFISLYQEKETEKASRYKQNILNIYNKRLLVYCKEIFFEKIERHPSLLLHYIKLFTQLHRPLPVSFDGYLTVIINQLTIHFENTTSTEVMDEIVSFFKRINPDKVGMLLDTVDFVKAIQSGDFVVMQKCSSLIKQFQLESLVNIECLTQLINSFERQTEQTAMLAILQILKNSHLWLFRSVFVSPSEESLRVYITSRDMLIKFLDFYMKNKDINQNCRITMFKIICEILRVVMSNKYQDTPIIMYQPEEELTLGLLRMLVQSSQLDRYEKISKAFEDIMTKRILNEPLATYILKICESSVKFSTTDCVADFLTIILLKGSSNIYQPVFRQIVQSEVMIENTTRFMFWRVFRTMVMRCDDTKRSAVMDILLGIYFNRVIAKKHTKILLNKLILFLAELIDQAFGERNPTIFIILQMLLKKTGRRYGKQTLSKINAIYLSKYSQEVEEFGRSAPVKAVKEILSKRTRLATSTVKKQRDQSQSDRDQASEGESHSQSSRSSTSRHSIMEEEETNDRDHLISGNKRNSKMSVESSGSRPKSNKKNQSQYKRKVK